MNRRERALRSSADRAFLVLIGIALASGALLVALLAVLLPHVPRVARGEGELAADGVPAVVLALATIGISLGLASLARQLWATLQLLRGLLRLRVHPPARLRALADALGVAGRIDLVADDRPFAFTYWFLRPRICLSTGLLRRLPDDELRAVLAHERYHLRQRDPLRLVVARYFAAGLYVVPLVDDLVGHYTLLKEIAADEDTVRALGDVRPLARALYRLVPHATDVDLGLLAPVGSLSVTEARIEQLVEGRPIPVRVDPVHLVLSLATLAGASALVAGRLPMAELGATAAGGWLSAGALLCAAVPGVTHQLRAVARR